MALDYSQTEMIRTGASMSRETIATLPKMHLCVMNPPFVRSVGGNLLFGSLPGEERKVLQKDLKKQVKKLSANVTAGLGSVFAALADKHLEVGGRLAFVLQAASASGEAWGPTRKLLADNYHLETVVSSHDAERPNFSENTDLSELLFIARKLDIGEKPGRTTYISLWRNPRSIHEAMHLANAIENTSNVVTLEGVGITSVRSSEGKLAEMLSAPAAIGEEIWLGALISQAELLRTSWSLQRGMLRVPGNDKEFTLPICRLHQLGGLGYDRRDIHDAFEVSHDDWSPYPAFWSHDAKAVISVAQSPNARLLARTAPAKGRKLKSASAVYTGAGRILLVERLWPITHSVLAVGFEEKVLGSTWWAFNDSQLNELQRKALLVWLNSTLSLLFYFGRRAVTRSAWMQMKQPAWESMPVLDVRRLTQEHLTRLANAYDEVASKSLAPLAQLDADPVRISIDDALCTVLGLPSLAPVRALLAREPGLTGRGIGGRLEFHITERKLTG